jgi:hypothetical protein
MAMRTVSFQTIGAACGMPAARWGILAAFDGPGDQELGGDTMVKFDSAGKVTSISMRCHDMRMFRAYAMGDV